MTNNPTTIRRLHAKRFTVGDIARLTGCTMRDVRQVLTIRRAGAVRNRQRHDARQQLLAAGYDPQVVASVFGTSTGKKQ